MRKLILFLLFIPVQMHAQKKIASSPVSKSNNVSLSHVFKDYSLFSIDAKALSTHVKTGDKNNIDFELVFPGITSMRLSLRENDILSSNYKLVAGTSNGKQVFPKTRYMTYAGKLADDAASSVFLTITDRSVFGIVQGKGKEYFIEPLRNFNKQAGAGLFVLYETKDVVPTAGVTCAASETAQRLSQAKESTLQLARTTITCKTVEMAIASDHLMYERYESVQGTEEHVIGVMNAMIGIFSNTQIGTSYYNFKINNQYVSTSYENDPLLENYSGNDPFTLLDRFESWGEAGNFELTYDIGQLWTARVMGGGISGVARPNGACTSRKYHVISDIFSGDYLTALVAHETGHSLGAGHDNYSNSIMAPGFYSAAPTSFSSISISEMNTFLSQATCFSTCENVAPVARFTSSQSPFTNGGYCVGSTITFTDASMGEVDAVAWTFQDGTPATSTSEVQDVVFNSSGRKTVTITASNSSGSTTFTKIINIGYVGTGDELVASVEEVCPNTPFTISFPAARPGAILQRYDWVQNKFITIGPIGATPLQFVSGNYTRVFVPEDQSYFVESEVFRAIWPYGDALPGCMAIAQKSIVILQGPKPMITGVNSVCPANAIQLQVTDTAEYPAPYVSYLWSPGGASTSVITINPTTSGLYSVTVVNENGCSNTATKNVVIGAGALGLSTTDINCNKATFNWTSDFNPAQWELEYKSTANGSKWINVPVPNAATRSVTVNNLKPNQNYQWHIRAKCGRAWTAYSDLALFKTLTSCNSLITQNKSVSTPEVQINESPEEFKAVAMPNPSNTNFRVAIGGVDNLKEPVRITVTDMMGRVVETRTATAGQVILVGDKYRPGAYLLRLMQGNKIKQIKLIKITD